MLLRDELQSQTPKVAAVPTHKEFPQFSPNPEQASYMFQLYQMMLAGTGELASTGELAQFDPAQFQSFLQTFQSHQASSYDYADTSIDSSSTYYSKAHDSTPEYCPTPGMYYGQDTLSPMPDYTQESAPFISNAVETCEEGEWGAPEYFEENELFPHGYIKPDPYTSGTRSYRETSLSSSMLERPRNKTLGGRSDQQLLKAVNLAVEEDDTLETQDAYHSHSQRRPSTAQPHNHKAFGKSRGAKNSTNESAPMSEHGPKKTEKRTCAKSFEKQSTPLDNDIDMVKVYCDETWLFIHDIPNPLKNQFAKPPQNHAKVADPVASEEGAFGFRLINMLPPVNDPQMNTSFIKKTSTSQ